MLMPSVFPNQVYTFDLTEGKGDEKKGMLVTILLIALLHHANFK